MFFPETCSDACPTWQNNLKRNLRLPWARLGFKTGIAKEKNFTKSNQTFYVYTFSFYHTSGNLIPVKLLFGSKGPFWESNFLCVYILRLPYLWKFDSRKAAFWFKRAVLGIKFPMCIHYPSTVTIPLEIWFPESFFLAQKGRFGNQISYVYTFAFYHTSWNLIPVKLLSGSKGPFWESNLLCVYILLVPYFLKFDSRKAAFWLKRAVLGIKFPMCIHSPSTIPLESFFLAQKGRFGNQISYVYTCALYHTSWNLIPVKLLSGSKGPFWESNFLCVYNCLLPYLLKFDSRKASFWLKRAVLGIKFPMCIHSPSTIPLAIWFP